MKRLLLILILTLCFQSWTKADDIRDFEIEGMSIGDSLLDYFTESEILNSKVYLYKSNKYASSQKKVTNSLYEVIQIEYKDNGKYIIESLIGRIDYDNNFNECYKKEKIILKELKNLFSKNANYKDYGTIAHPADPSGKSTGTWHTFKMNDGSGWIYLECMNWSEELTKKNYWKDALKITILTQEFGEWLNSSGY